MSFFTIYEGTDVLFEVKCSEVGGDVVVPDSVRYRLSEQEDGLSRSKHITGWIDVLPGQVTSIEVRGNLNRLTINGKPRSANRKLSIVATKGSYSTSLELSYAIKKVTGLEVA